MINSNISFKLMSSILILSILMVVGYSSSRYISFATYSDSACTQLVRVQNFDGNACQQTFEPTRIGSKETWKCSASTNSTNDFIDATIYDTKDCSDKGTLIPRAIAGSKICTSIGNNLYLKATCQSEPEGSSLNKQQNFYDLQACAGKAIGDVRTNGVCNSADTSCTSTPVGPLTFYYKTDCFNKYIFSSAIFLALIFSLIF